MELQRTDTTEQGSDKKEAGASKSCYSDFVHAYLVYTGVKCVSGHFVTRRIREDFVGWGRKGVVPVYMHRRLCSEVTA